jgi:hypothetical protein
MRGGGDVYFASGLGYRGAMLRHGQAYAPISNALLGAGAVVRAGHLT